MIISESKLRRLIRSVLSEVMSRRGTSVYEFLKSEGVPDISPRYSAAFNKVLRKYKKCIPSDKVKSAYDAFQQGERRTVESVLSPYIDTCVRQEFNSAEADMNAAFSDRSNNIRFPDDGIGNKQKRSASPGIFSLDDYNL
jgi:hypothetical protein